MDYREKEDTIADLKHHFGLTFFRYYLCRRNCEGNGVIEDWGKKITVCQTAFDFKLVSSSLVVSHLHLAGNCLGPLCFFFKWCVTSCIAVMGYSKQSLSCYIQCIHVKVDDAVLYSMLSMFSRNNWLI